MLGLAMAMGIEAQEAGGQRELVGQSERLPVRGFTPETLTRFGFKVGAIDESDGLWRVVEFPAGWRLSPTDHPMWSRLLDAQGRSRARVFYKAAFYDRDAFGFWEPRYVVDHEFRGERKEERYVVKDTASGALLMESAWMPREGAQGAQEEVHEAKERAHASAVAWLLEKYPLAEDPTAYW